MSNYLRIVCVKCIACNITFSLQTVSFLFSSWSIFFYGLSRRGLWRLIGIRTNSIGAVCHSLTHIIEKIIYVSKSLAIICVTRRLYCVTHNLYFISEGNPYNDCRRDVVGVIGVPRVHRYIRCTIYRDTNGVIYRYIVHMSFFLTFPNNSFCVIR